MSNRKCRNVDGEELNKPIPENKESFNLVLVNFENTLKLNSHVPDFQILQLRIFHFSFEQGNYKIYQWPAHSSKRFSLTAKQSVIFNYPIVISMVFTLKKCLRQFFLWQLRKDHYGVRLNASFHCRNPKQPNFLLGFIFRVTRLGSELPAYLVPSFPILQFFTSLVNMLSWCTLL